MENIKVAVSILDEGQKYPPGYKPASGHIVFDVRMTLERNARWVNDGHRTPEPKQSTYDGVVSRKSMIIALTYTSPNIGAYIPNTYQQAPTLEKHDITY